MKYALLLKRDWDHETERLQDCPGSVIVPVERLGQWTEDMTGRAYVLTYGSVGRKLRNGERVYIAPRNPLGSGLLIQKVS